MCVKSGYKTLTVIELANVLQALEEGNLSFRAVRVYLGCLALVAIREAARRSRQKRHEKPRDTSHYRLEELSRLTGLSCPVVKKALASLKRADLLSFSSSEIVICKEAHLNASHLLAHLAGKRSPHRPLPIPRSALRFLARCPKQALVKTTIAYLARGLTLDRKTGEVRGAGTVKASWIADTMNLSLRSVKAARNELISLGLITKDTASHQCKLNRDGAYFRLNLDWKEKGSDSEPLPPPVTDKDRREIAPPQVKTEPTFAPLKKDKKTSYESKNQETRASEPTGVYKTERRRGEPTLRNIQREDLCQFARVDALYHQAVQAGWITSSESSYLNFLAAAIRARTQTKGDPVRIFVGILKKQLFHHITHEEEERARAAIRKHREGIGLQVSSTETSTSTQPQILETSSSRSTTGWIAALISRSLNEKNGLRPHPSV